MEKYVRQSSVSWNFITDKPSGFNDNIDDVGGSPWNQIGVNLLQYGNSNQGKIGISY